MCGVNEGRKKPHKAKNLYYVFNRCQFLITIDPILTYMILILAIKELSPIKAK